MSRNGEKEDKQLWTKDISILWRDGKWLKVIPRSTQSRIDMVNSVARFSIGLSLIFSLLLRSFLPIGLGFLGLFASSRMAETVYHDRGRRRRPYTNNGTLQDQESQIDVNDELEAEQVVGVQNTPSNIGPIQGGSGGAYANSMGPVSWTEIFGASQEGGPLGASQGGPLGAHVAANDSANGIQYFPPATQLAPPEGNDADEVLVPPQFIHSNSQLHSTYQAGWPTSFGPAPSPYGGGTTGGPNPGQFTRPEWSSQVNRAFGGTYQPADRPSTFSSFTSDGGASSSPLTPSIPHPTAGQNFSLFNASYQPHQVAPAGAPLQTNNTCFPPSPENPLGNPEVAQNRVARPHLCPVADPRSTSTQFIDQLYESPSQVGAGYQFMPFPVQDVVEARDNFQDWVYKDTQTHYKDKYSRPEDAGGYNITDLISPPGF
jgi:hypothetical protein